MIVGYIAKFAFFPSVMGHPGVSPLWLMKVVLLLTKLTFFSEIEGSTPQKSHTPSSEIPEILKLNNGIRPYTRHETNNYNYVGGVLCIQST